MASLRRLAPAALLLLLSAAAQSAPVRSDQVAEDPYEQALSWTMAALTGPNDGRQDVEAMPGAEPAPVRTLPALHGSMPAGGVPDPGAYALMGLGLLVAGLAGRLLAGRQRGFSKKT